MLDPLEIINFFYSPEDPAREILLLHSTQVRNKALFLSRGIPGIDLETVSIGAMLHDIGIRFCNAPDIGCYGEEDYLLHGILGAENLRAFKNIESMEKFARICERHTGSGITALEIRERALPLPERDLIPETIEEKVICLADKFFSKSGDMAEKTIPQIRKQMEKFGQDTLWRFDDLCREFKINIIS